MMAGVATVCEECEGKRFEASVLEYHLGGRDISEVLAMSVTQAEEFFGTAEARTPAAHKILDRLVDSGKSMIVIEHHPAVMAHADWIIDLGPGAGHDGGRIVFEGTPGHIVADGSTLTGAAPGGLRRRVTVAGPVIKPVRNQEAQATGRT